MIELSTLCNILNGTDELPEEATLSKWVLLPTEKVYFEERVSSLWVQMLFFSVNPASEGQGWGWGGGRLSCSKAIRNL